MRFKRFKICGLVFGAVFTKNFGQFVFFFLRSLAAQHCPVIEPRNVFACKVISEVGRAENYGSVNLLHVIAT